MNDPLRYELDNGPYAPGHSGIMKTTKSQAKQLLTHVPAEGLVLDLYSASDDTLVGRMSPGSAVADMELPADLDAACTGEDEWRFLANTELGEMFLDMWSAGELA